VPKCEGGEMTPEQQNQKIVDQLCAKIETLKADNANLRAAVTDVIDYFGADYYLDGSETDLMIKRLQAALAAHEEGDE